MTIDRVTPQRDPKTRHCWYEQPDGSRAVVVKLEWQLTSADLAALIAYLRTTLNTPVGDMSPEAVRRAVKHVLYRLGDSFRDTLTTSSITPADRATVDAAYGRPR